MTLAKVLEQVKNLCVKYRAKEIILFGSRAKGTALERSDIDIGGHQIIWTQNLKKMVIIHEYIDRLYELRNHAGEILTMN